MFSLSSPLQPSSLPRSYSPQTPSPLRTSQNANRLGMSNAVKSSPLSGSWREGDENWSPVANQSHLDTPLTDFSTPSTNADSWTKQVDLTPATTSSSTSFNFTPATSTIFTPATTVSSGDAKPTFVYESRARSSSPAAQMSKHATDARDKRKTQFLDKIRNRRIKGRDERMGDQLLRMDYVKERRMWEEEMRRRAEKEADEAADTEMDTGEEEASPTEEKEIEELVSYLNEDELTDDGYDEAFIEVLQLDDMDMS